MKKIITREVREKKGRRNKTLIGIILAGLMILSVAGYAFYNTGDREEIKKINYNGFIFILKEDGLWHAEVDGIEIATVYNPIETKNISSDIDMSLNDYVGKVLYFSYDSDYEGIREINRNIGRFAIRTQTVCLEECEENLPVKNCDNNIIIIRRSEENLIKQEDRCIYVLSNQEEVLKTSDALIFKIFNIG